MNPVSIATELHSRAIETLSLSQYATNRLRARGIKTLGQLHGMSIAVIGGFAGIGANTLESILQAIQRLGTEQTNQPDATTSDDEMVPSSHRLDVPSPVRHWPISTLTVPQTTLTALAEYGIHTVGDLNGATPSELINIRHIGAKGVARIEAAVNDLRNLPAMEVLKHDANGSPLAPMMSIQVLRAVASASCPAEEVEATLLGTSARNAEMIRLRWSRPHGRRRILEEIASRFGITRERTRQITQKHNDILRASNLWLPKLAQAVNVVETSGGALPMHELVRRAAEVGAPIGADVLPYIEALGELGLIPRIVFSQRAKLWVSEHGFDSWLSGSKALDLRRDIARRIRESLRRVGCVPVSTLSHSPFGLRHALSLASAGDLRFRRVDDYLLPRESHPSALQRWTEQMLAIAPELPLSEIQAALKGCAVVRKGHRERIVVPPANVLRELLASDGKFTVEETIVRLSAAPEKQLLSATEQVVVSAIEAQGNIASWAQIMETAKAAGCAEATAALALREPYIVRRSTGIYALRGRPVAPEVLKKVIRERNLARRACLKRLIFSGGPRARAIYELTTFAAHGVLPVPGKLRNIAHKRWRVRVPGGREFQVRMRNGFIWPLRNWIRDSGLKPGDMIMADFDISNGTIDLDIIS